MKKLYKIADLIVEMDSFGRTIEQSEKYLTAYSGVPDIVICANLEKAKLTFPHLSDSECEYMATGANFYRNLIQHNGIMLHSSAVVVKGKAYIFTADSGVGKSTHTNNWLKLFGENAYILNDDKPALRCVGGTWYAYGTPWSGKNDISKNERAPIAGIAVLERSEKNEIEAFSGIEAVKEILKQTNKPNDLYLRGKMMELINDLLTEIPVWKFGCTQAIESVIISYEAMSGERI